MTQLREFWRLCAKVRLCAQIIALLIEADNLLYTTDSKHTMSWAHSKFTSIQLTVCNLLYAFRVIVFHHRSPPFTVGLVLQLLYRIYNSFLVQLSWLHTCKIPQSRGNLSYVHIRCGCGCGCRKILVKPIMTNALVKIVPIFVIIT